MALIQLSIHKQKHSTVLKTFSLKAVKCRFLDGPLFWKMLFHINEKSMRGPFFSFYLKTFFFVRKMTKKGQNKSPIILTKIKALLSVQEHSWNLLSWWRFGERRRRPARSLGPHSSSINYILMPLVQLRHLTASQLQRDSKFVSEAQTRRPSVRAEKHWRTPSSSPGWGKRRQRCGIKQKNAKSGRDVPAAAAFKKGQTFVIWFLHIQRII